MKKKVLIALVLIGCSSFVIGTTIAGISAAAVGGLSFLNAAEPYEERTIDVVASDININVEELNNKIVVNGSTSATTVSISVFENNYEHYQTSEDANDFTITFHDDVPWNLKLFDFSNTNRTMTITVPLSYGGSLNLNTTNGLIDINDISLTGELSIDSVNGLISVSDVTVTENIVVQTTNAQVEMRNVHSDKDIRATAINAAIAFVNLSAANLNAQTTNGSISAERLAIANKMSFTTLSGRISLDDIDVGSEIRLTTTNGEILGNVKGPSTDYDVESHITIGLNNLASYNAQVPTTGTKLLYVSCTNGRINIVFK